MGLPSMRYHSRLRSFVMLIQDSALDNISFDDDSE